MHESSCGLGRLFIFTAVPEYPHKKGKGRYDMETLRYGSRGGGVLLLQIALRREGSYRGVPDGIFGTRTLNGVRRFQTENGLVPDGIAGPKTLSAAEKFLLGFFTVKLRRGDTFYRLGKRYGVSSQAIMAANPGLDPADLPMGGEIRIPYRFPAVETAAPWTSELLEYTVKALTARYPFITAETVGRSVSGKPLRLLKIGSGSGKLFINAAHHANEWITSPLTLGFLESCASALVEKGTVSGRSASALFAAATAYFMPMVDPDGVDVVNGAAGKEDFSRALAIAEDYPDVPFPEGWKANIEGTDLNLNYPAGWDAAREIKYEMGFVRPAPRDYVGPAPLSAPESRAVYELTRRMDFDLTVSYHTQGGAIYWKYGDIAPEGSRRIAEAMAAVSGYSIEDVPYESGFAGYKDWFIDEFRRPGFTVEAGRGRSPLPLSQFDELAADNYPLMAVALEAAGERREE